MLKKYEYILENLDCASCANKIQNKLAENKDYQNVNVNFNTRKITFISDLEEINVKKYVKEMVAQLEPEVEVLEPHAKEEDYKNKEDSRLLRIIIGVLLTILAFYENLSETMCHILIIAAYIILLSRTAINAFKLLCKKTISESFLITVSCIGAYFLGETFEGLMVIILYEIGKLLEDRAVNHTRKSIADLMDIKPEYANLMKNNQTEKVLPELVHVGDCIVVKTGEKVPLDGIVVKGTAKLNTASLTGESKSVSVKEKDQVLSGSINEDGLIELQVTESYENSTVSKILDLVENATDKKAKTETFVNKAATIYTPIVIGLAILVAIALPWITDVSYQESIYRALIFLVVSCPCAIAISVPLSYFSGIGRASKSGILVKGSNYLDALQNVKEIVFDKTGTITKGEFGIEKIVLLDSSYTEEQILEFAALGENFSNHPIATTIVNAYHGTIDERKVENFKEISGKGIEYKINEKYIKIGSAQWLKQKVEENVGTNIYVQINQDIIGYIVLNDIIKPEAKETLLALKKLNMKTRMFTGDNEKVAQKVAKELEIDDVKYKMLPQDKYQEIEKLLENYKSTNCKVAFVGDGINDAPVLALADVGISMGGVGASSAIEASDVVIMTDDLRKIEEAIRISRKTGNIIKQNLIFALGVKLLVLGFSIGGIAQMWQAIFADVGVTLLTILNTLRILKYNG